MADDFWQIFVQAVKRHNKEQTIESLSAAMKAHKAFKDAFLKQY
jgi:hypothetical protein